MDKMLSILEKQHRVQQVFNYRLIDSTSLNAWFHPKTGEIIYLEIMS